VNNQNLVLNKFGGAEYSGWKSVLCKPFVKTQSAYLARSRASPWRYWWNA